jgi:hypothetical protein
MTTARGMTPPQRVCCCMGPNRVRHAKQNEQRLTNPALLLCLPLPLCRLLAPSQLGGRTMTARVMTHHQRVCCRMEALQGPAWGAVQAQQRQAAAAV